MAVSYSLTTPKLGTVSASSLVKSASTLAGQIASFNDTQAKITYENSAKTDSDLEAYLTYLSGRVDTLQSSGKITDATKSLTMQQEMVTATHSNMSANIQRENIQIMAGNATKTDKLQLINNQYTTALNIGDQALAQSLESQAYTLSQEIQYEAQTAASSAATLAKANATGQNDVATTLDTALKALDANIQNTGMKSFNAVAQAWVNANQSTLGALGVKINSQPNYFDIVSGVTAAKYNAHMLAYQAALPVDPQTAQTYYNQAQAVAYTSVSTLAGSMTPQELFVASQSPNEFAYNETTGKLEKTQVTGYQYLNYNGQNIVAPTYSGSIQKNTVLTPSQTALMTKLGLSFSQTTSGANKGTAADGVQVEASSNTPQWLQNIIGSSGVTNVYSVNGMLQFEGDSSTGLGKSFFTVGIDSRGLAGLFENTSDGRIVALGGEYGFNANAVQNLLANAASKQISVQQQAQSAELKLQQQAIKIPSLQLSTPPTAPPTISNVTTAQPTFKSVTAPTTNPQQAAGTNAIQPTNSSSLQGGTSLQGGGMRLQ